MRRHVLLLMAMSLSVAVGSAQPQRYDRVLVVPAAKPVVLDGDLGDWDMSAAAVIEAGPGRGAQVALACDDTHLLAAFDVRDDSPMKNEGRNPALLFKTGDACDLWLATDPEADPQRTRAAQGDVRLLFSVLEGQPVCVLYQPVLRPGRRLRLPVRELPRRRAGVQLLRLSWDCLRAGVVQWRMVRWGVLLLLTLLQWSSTVLEHVALQSRRLPEDELRVWAAVRRISVPPVQWGAEPVFYGRLPGLGLLLLGAPRV